jgi:hypothetical protein
LIITGILTGIVVLFRQDFGFYIFISAFLVVLSKQLNHSKQKKMQAKLSTILNSEVYLFSGLFFVLFPVLAYFLINSAFKELIYDTVIFPITVYPKVRSLHFPEFKISALVFYLPLFVFVLAGIRLLFYDWKDEIKGAIPWLTLFLLLSGIGLFNYTRVRSCMTHLLPTMIPAILLFILLLNELLKRFRCRIYFFRSFIWVILFLASFSLLFYSIKPNFVKLKSLSKKENKAKLDVARAQGFYDDSELAQSQISAIKYIQGKTAQDEKIFVGNTRHDRVVNSDVMFYFLCERHSATKYYELHPGLTNTKKIQNEIINELKKADVRYIVLWSGSEGVNEPNESNKSSGIKELDNFIQKNYTFEKIFGPYLILRRI